jgi:carbon storage regulator
MLVLSRKVNESIVINSEIVITVIEVRDDKVRLGIEAPAQVTVHRREVFDAIQREEGRQSSSNDPPPGEESFFA